MIYTLPPVKEKYMSFTVLYTLAFKYISVRFVRENRALAL